MSVFIAGRSIPQANLLSQSCRRVLQFIDGGEHWLRWAIESHEHRYAFSDEGTMLDGVQQGLHGSRMTWLPRIGLQIGPIKLLSLTASDLDALRNIELGEETRLSHSEAQDVLARHRLLTNNELGAFRPFLASVGAADAPLLQQLDFRESVALHQLAGEVGMTTAGRDDLADAARFALLHARRPIEFADYFRFYQHVSAGGGSSEHRMSRATGALQQLLPMLFDFLDGPQLPQLPSPEQVREAIGASLAANRQIGYARISLAAQQMALCFDNSPDLLRDDHSLREAAQWQLRDAQEFLNEHPVSRGQLGQDGASVQFAIDGSRGQALIQVEDNVITLQDYRRTRHYLGDEAQVGYRAGTV
ncbi:hypothetical protein [Stenotrophomonas maltophilia]|uniref:hypothetical protein n=1 Tax=Stenotrophomonas maltophilia TaxID=40324 RepID=UPI000C2682D6|nr:hypothetical protein [Stenotrophomonas maltophilia]PJL58834.1 hypothetical protein B9Y82_08860 [Stenotrophomonas maltophilia]